MSLLIGAPGDRWRLRRAVDALGASARAAARPSGLWLAGAVYPSVATSLNALLLFNEVLAGMGLRLWRGEFEAFRTIAGFHVLLLLIAPITFRLIAGLAGALGPARTLPDPAHLRLRLRAAWRAGRGLTWPALGLVVCVQLLVVAAVLALVGPALLVVRALHFTDVTGPTVLLLLPVVALLLLYGTCLHVLSQLALHSLTCNRRGAASALTHAWRLVRHSPWATVRAGLVDVALSISIGLVTLPLAVAAGWERESLLAAATWTLAHGFEGVARAGYWGRAYRELGGLTPADGVPGLA